MDEKPRAAATLHRVIHLSKPVIIHRSSTLSSIYLKSLENESNGIVFDIIDLCVFHGQWIIREV